MTYTTLKEDKIKKRQLLRNNEYYDVQNTFDMLYEKSKSNYKFKNLVQYIINDKNILLAYRNIKKNKGSKTGGTDKKTIIDISDIETRKLVNYVKNKFANYVPQPVRRIEIPKPNGKTRPLGIPTIEDRLIQQCIKQVLEPICEAKFYKHSYGFRPNRSTKHAIARSVYLVNINKLHYAVDIDIKGFFDNVNHGKLLKQIWNLGVQDKNLICIISKMLKSEIEGIKKPTKGTPQGGILSPLLSNIVLNELDWWISSQWETFKTDKQYSKIDSGRQSLRKSSNLKEMFVVRYADDFKIFCRDYKTAQKVFIATKTWLKDRLHLDISPEKSKVTNLRKNYTEYLGFKFKAICKRNKYVAKSHISDKAKTNIKAKIKQKIINIRKSPIQSNVTALNSLILGVHEYYKCATYVNIDFKEINFLVTKTLYNRLRTIASNTGIKSKVFTKFYGNYNFKTYYVAKTPIFPIAGITTKPAMSFSQDICNYTQQGRKLIHKTLKSVKYSIMKYLMNNPQPNQSTEFNDNRISLYVGQNGKCAITGIPLEIGNMEIHHKKPKEKGGTDEYKNLIYVLSSVHKLTHATNIEIINKYTQKLNLDTNALEKLNLLRKKVGNHIV